MVQKTTFRFQELHIFLYRIFLAFLFFAICRLLFIVYNFKILEINSLKEWNNIFYGGLFFDATAIVYTSALFVVLSLLPFFINTNKKYQKVVFWVYFIPNGIALALNHLDLMYYRFVYTRSMSNVLESVEHEVNKTTLFFSFLIDYWHVFLSFFVLLFLWIFLYNRYKIVPQKVEKNAIYVIYSLIVFAFFGLLSNIAVRGDYHFKTRPQGIVEANKFVSKLKHADAVLNTPFTIIRTLGKSNFNVDYQIKEEFIKKEIKPLKQYKPLNQSQPDLNVVIIILESFGREYIGHFNQDLKIKDYKSYTPFIDSLANHSLTFQNSFANGYKSLHAMSSVLSGVPSFQVAYTSSPYVNQPISSLISILNEKGYQTSFFHGAPNASMGFQGYGNILGIHQYYGMNEYDNNADYDGYWAIWDEEYMQFMAKNLNKNKQPFCATFFSATSHEPFVIPEKYKNTFKAGDLPIHKGISYTDFSLKQFFKTAKKQAWFKNTLFVITADHCNQVFYDEYYKPINRLAIPIIFYHPEEKIIGKRYEFANQMDIYPTILHWLGYEKSFRSWGRSLLDPDEKPFHIAMVGNNYFWQQDGYIFVFNGQIITEIYNFDSDKAMTKNLIGKMKHNIYEQRVKAFLQDYFQRIKNRQMN